MGIDKGRIKYLKLRYGHAMRIISNKTLIVFSAAYPTVAELFQVWRKFIESRQFESFVNIKTAFNPTDKVGYYYVFEADDNKY